MTVSASPAEVLEVRNPATGELLRRVPAPDRGAVEEAVERARKAQRRWEVLAYGERLRPLRRFHDLLLERADELLDTIQKETGKSRRDALSEILTVAGEVRYLLTHGRRHLSEQRRRAAVTGMSWARVGYIPQGVVGVIGPWNYPLILSIGDAIPALAAGNAVVLKPSERTPLSALLGRNLLLEAGLDRDLLRVLPGTGEVARELIQHVDAVAFTGGEAAGRQVGASCGERLIPCTLELGGKNPTLVLDGAPLEDAATALATAAFSNAGQSCLSIERVYVEAPVYDRFLELLKARTARLRLGWSLGWDVDIGCLIGEEHLAKVRHQVDTAVGAGARVLAGGRARPDLGPTFFEPTLLADVEEGMELAGRETFGPVVALHPVRDVEEAVYRANESPYGLNATVWAGSRRLGRKVARRLRAGSVGVGSTLLIYGSFDAPMGGIGASGLGRRHGAEGLRRFTETRSLIGAATRGGGFETRLLAYPTDERRARRLLRAARLWRRIPGFR